MARPNPRVRLVFFFLDQFWQMLRFTHWIVWFFCIFVHYLRLWPSVCSMQDVSQISPVAFVPAAPSPVERTLIPATSVLPGVTHGKKWLPASGSIRTRLTSLYFYVKWWPSQAFIVLVSGGGATNCKVGMMGGIFSCPLCFPHWWGSSPHFCHERETMSP